MSLWVNRSEFFWQWLQLHHVPYLSQVQYEFKILDWVENIYLALCILTGITVFFITMTMSLLFHQRAQPSHFNQIYWLFSPDQVLTIFTSCKTYGCFIANSTYFRFRFHYSFRFTHISTQKSSQTLMPLSTNSWWSSFHDAIVRHTICIWSHSDWFRFTKWTICLKICLDWRRYYTRPWHVSVSWSEQLIFSKTSNFLPSLSGGM